MTNKNIFREMGGLDPDLIMKAAPDVPHKKSVNKTWVKWASIAACFALILCIGIPTLLHIYPIDNHRKSPYPFDMLQVGESTTYKAGRIFFDSLDNTSFTFTLTINEEKSELTYEYSYALEMNGWIEYQDGTKPNLTNDAIQALIITVNGEVVQEIPDVPGEYSITIDFSKLVNDEGKINIADILMWGIASFDIDYHEQ